MYKSRLQELCHQKVWCLPTYDTSKEGPDHDPRFKASVTVNGDLFHSAGPCRSSKEAQNDAAKIAFDHYTNAQSSRPLFSGCTNASNETNDSENAKTSTGFPRNSQNCGNSSTDGENKDCTGGSRPEDGYGLEEMHFVYKFQLQSFALKKNLGLPMYTYTRQGPSHSSWFKAVVTVDGQTFESPEFMRTAKEAEHAAARAALTSLSHGNQEDECGFYKNLLQELCQKEGFGSPRYQASISGQSHMPSFCSTVEVNSELFEGTCARTKKQAEMSAAKKALLTLKERQRTLLSQWCSVVQAVDHKSATSLSTTLLDLRWNVNNDSACAPALRSEFADGEGTASPSRIQAETIEQEFSRLMHLNKPQTNAVPTSKLPSKDDNVRSADQEDQRSKSSSAMLAEKKECSSQSSAVQEPENAMQSNKRSAASDEVYKHLRDPFPAKPEEVSDSPVEKDMEQRENVLSTNSSSHLCNRIQVYPRGADMKLPPGAIPLPIDGDQWIAVRLELPDQTSCS